MADLDLHANEDEEPASLTRCGFHTKTYPHVDSEEIGMKAAECMVKTVRGEVRPYTACRRPGMFRCIYRASDQHPMKDIYDRCREWEKVPGVICASVAPGYAYADVIDIGMSIFVVTNDDPELAEKSGPGLKRPCVELKGSFTEPLPDAK